jgi:1-acyl-sn-glycerol-3-phosphate acyltransferase|tara:strand:+ start:436 stop:1032 length:597 start_codon:yes stop_codon:yes gene_type:complete
LVYPIFKRTIFPIAKLFLKEIKGIENIPKKGPFIITSNHESYIDPFFICSIIIPLLNKKIYFLAGKGRFWDLFGDGISERWAGCVCADKGKEKAIQKLLHLLKKGNIIAIFIEGSRSPDGKLRKGKTGVVRLALKAHVPILPIGIMGSFEIAPRDKLIPKLKRAKLHIGKLIYLIKDCINFYCFLKHKYVSLNLIFVF